MSKVEITIDKAREIIENGEREGTQSCGSCPREGLECNSPCDCIKLMLSAARMVYGSDKRTCWRRDIASKILIKEITPKYTESTIKSARFVTSIMSVVDALDDALREQKRREKL